MSVRQRYSLEGLLEYVRGYVRDCLPGCAALAFRLTLQDGRAVELPVVPAVTGPDGSAEAFVPTPFQEAILEALEGTALRTAALGAAVGDRGRLYKPGGLQELRERGLVAWHSRKGFYRVDAPPEELMQERG